VRGAIEFEFDEIPDRAAHSSIPNCRATSRSSVSASG
jgi:hypothetical protein